MSFGNENSRLAALHRALIFGRPAGPFIVLLVSALGSIPCACARPQLSIGELKNIYRPEIQGQEWYINDHALLRDSKGVWHMFGTTGKEPDVREIQNYHSDDEKNFAHAVAPALTGPWRTLPFALTADPARKELHLWAPYVLEHNGLWHMFYAAGNVEPNGLSRIHLAVSKDLLEWKRSDDNPLVSDVNARDPFIMPHDHGWIMYYTMNSPDHRGYLVVAARTSADLIHWGERRIVFYDSKNPFGSESPFVVKRANTYYLFVGPRPSKKGNLYGTEVFASSDPLRFEPSAKVGAFDIHAAEVVESDGAWWITHSGWGKGGLYVAELKWR
ncbi:MAG: family 43 glycosylhydrolase [Spirochaetia bacterium]|nr:family 43 glycosylhydrolase [Spirochaetia bacterium]